VINGFGFDRFLRGMNGFPVIHRDEAAVAHTPHTAKAILPLAKSAVPGRKVAPDPPIRQQFLKPRLLKSGFPTSHFASSRTLRFREQTRPRQGSVCHLKRAARKHIIDRLNAVCEIVVADNREA
jgi:hypothetical protein